MPTRVWGVGLCRTGTKSLTRALQILGWKCFYHNPPSLEFLHDLETRGRLSGAAEGCVMSDYRTINEMWPGKFILTTRDRREWLESCKMAIAHYDADRIDYLDKNYPAMVRNRVARYGRFVKRKGWPEERGLDESMLYNYYRHHSGVLGYFNGRTNLLVMDITKGDGWVKLCEFLNCDIPRTPFPKVKDEDGPDCGIGYGDFTSVEETEEC